MITLPALPIRKTRIGGNLIVQHVFMGATCKAQIFEVRLNVTTSSARS
jgi:hypothetical protein